MNSVYIDKRDLVSGIPKYSEFYPNDCYRRIHWTFFSQRILLSPFLNLILRNG